jgi:hypothetical protein
MNKSDAEIILKQVQHKIQHDTDGLALLFVIPNLFRDLAFCPLFGARFRGKGIPPHFADKG